MSLFKGINVVSIEVPDLVAGREFYRDVLELGEPEYDLLEHGWIEFSSGGAHGNLSLTRASEGWAPSQNVTVVFNVADCYKTCEALRAKGVKCDDPVEFSGFVVYCSSYDPFGNRLQMCGPA